MAHFLIKAVLSTKETEFYQSTKDSPADEVKATHIVICNSKPTAVNAFLSFAGKDGRFDNGAVLSGYPVPPHGTVEVTDRIIRSEGKILAYASEDDALALSVDITGADGEYEVKEKAVTKRFL